MRPHIIQIIAALVAGIAFCLAFMTMGLALVSGACMVVGLAAVGCLAWSLIRHVRSSHRRHAA